MAGMVVMYEPFLDGHDDFASDEQLRGAGEPVGFDQNRRVGLTAPTEARQARTQRHVVSRQNSRHPLQAWNLQTVVRAQHIVGLDVVKRHQLVESGIKALRDPRERIAVFHDVDRVGYLGLSRTQTSAKKQGNQKR